MTKIRNALRVAAATTILLVGLSGCGKKEGPTERAGKEIDKTVESAGKQIEKAGAALQGPAPAGSDARSRRAILARAILAPLRAMVRAHAQARTGAERSGVVSQACAERTTALAPSAHDSRLRKYRGDNGLCVSHVEPDHAFFA